MMFARKYVAVIAALIVLPLGAQKPRRQDQMSGYDRSARATVLHTANVYVMADSSNPPITTVTPGHEVVVMARNGPWVNVFANTDSKEDQDPDSAPEFGPQRQSGPELRMDAR
jgi:hypothetical protein